MGLFNFCVKSSDILLNLFKPFELHTLHSKIVNDAHSHGILRTTLILRSNTAFFYKNLINIC